MTSEVIDTDDWQGANAYTIGEFGFGVIAENIAAAGTNGAGYCYNDITLPADNGKEICGRITRMPTLGTLFAYEDTSFIYTGASDSFDYQLYVDGVATGSVVTVTLTLGLTAGPGATLTGTGSLAAGAAFGGGSGTAYGVSITGTSLLNVGTATGGGTPPPTGIVAIAALKRMSHSVLTDTTVTTLYTVPGGTKGVMKEVLVCNSDNVVRTVTLQAGSTVGTQDRVFSSLTLQPGETKGFTFSIVLDPADVITGGASINGVVSCLISGFEVH